MTPAVRREARRDTTDGILTLLALAVVCAALGTGCGGQAITAVGWAILVLALAAGLFIAALLFITSGSDGRALDDDDEAGA